MYQNESSLNILAQETETAKARDLIVDAHILQMDIKFLPFTRSGPGFFSPLLCSRGVPLLPSSLSPHSRQRADPLVGSVIW
jgi:hypothetical protein